ncbi:PGF-pre-PGF domain-containing protein [Methanosarcina sp. MSH10X1]|nr:PGF-pre-PGF domain-containing protein [Methanosarcina sp. MSH10X1]
MTNSGSNTVSVIDTATNRVKTTISVGEFPVAFGQFIKQPVLPFANFNSSVSEGYAPLSVRFTDLSKNAIEWSWIFGDGAVSAEQNPVHIYSVPGTYSVNLTVNNEKGTASKLATIAVMQHSNSDGGSTGGSTGVNSGGSYKSGGSRGGGGGGGSPEPARNVQVKEISQASIINGKPVKFSFARNATCVVYVSFDAKKTLGKTTTIAEQLKGKSALVSGLPEGEVYNSFNVWVGSGGVATSKNIENPVVCFKVEKSWLQDKKIDRNSITLDSYRDKTWSYLPAKLLKEDSKYLYFTAETPMFSSFAITGRAVVKETGNETEPATGVQDAGQESIAAGSKDGQKSETGKSTSIPGFEAVCGVVSLFAVSLYQRKK